MSASVGPWNGGWAGQQRVEDGAEAIDVARGGEVLELAGTLLGRHVIGRAGTIAGMRQLAAGFHPLGQAEVRDVRLAVAIDQDVLGLQVAMEHAALMGMVDRSGDRGHQVGRGAGVFLEWGEFVGEVATFDQLHTVEVALGWPNSKTGTMFG